ncbi:response regulator transcription factor [Cellulomonas sp. NPDC089187]|uniref:response regulator transcription factor n=1 Tax=Cellulomonas sp. NPDC089187 TaxID=3154970 RepID=UPI003431B713
MSLPTPPARVLVVEDEPALAEAVAAYLSRGGHQVRIVGAGDEALEVARAWDPAVLVLDLGLPEVDGVEVCRRLRDFSTAYVIMVTARAEESDVLTGLAAGADDYVTKPFRPRELVARVDTVLRRARTPGTLPPTPVRRGDLTVDTGTREVTLRGEPVSVTPTEFELLTVLLARPHEALTRAELIEGMRGGPWFGDPHLVDQHVLHLRRKLGGPVERERYIRTVRGVGYRWGDG